MRRTRWPTAFLLAFVVVAAVPATATAVPNPPWKASCPMRITLVIDVSGSMSGYLYQVQTAAVGMIDGLRDKQSAVSVVVFSGIAATVATDVNVNDPAARDTLKQQVVDLSAGGGTNWASGLSEAAAKKADVVLLVTDGVPTHSDTGRSDALVGAVAASDTLKKAGARVVSVGVGLGATGGTDNLKQVSGPTQGQDWFDTDVSSLPRTLRGIAASACGVPVAVLPPPLDVPVPVPGPPLIDLPDLPNLLPDPADLNLAWWEVAAGVAALLAVAGLLGYLRFRGQRPRDRRAVRASTAKPRARRVDATGLAERVKESKGKAVGGGRTEPEQTAPPTPSVRRTLSLGVLKDPDQGRDSGTRPQNHD